MIDVYMIIVTSKGVALTPHQQMRTLGCRLLFYRYAYYVMSNPIESDAEYDRQEIRLKELEAIYPEYKYKGPNSITETVGSDNYNTYPGMIKSMYDSYIMHNK